ncbi:MAG: ribonuclease R, partial [Lewinella sp.]|nr:ribonuclease R [Lewinella sp.]
MSKKGNSKIKGQKLSSGQLQKEVLKLFRRQPKKVLNPRQVIKKLKVANNKDSVQHVITKLVEANELRDLGDYRYQLNRSAGPAAQRDSNNVAEGRVDMTRTGAAYIIVDGQEDDIFIAPRNINTALHGDTVKIRFWTPRGRRKPEGEVIEVVKRAAESFVGTLNIFARFALVALDGKLPMDIMIDLGKLNGAQEGDLVVVKIIEWSSGRYNHPVGEVTTVLGKPGTSEIEMQAILINNGFDPAFPEEVLRE